MLLYFTNDKTLTDNYENVFKEQLDGYDEHNYAVYDHGFRNSNNFLIKSSNHGITGLVCFFPDDSFISAEQVPPPEEENILFVVKFFGGYERSLKSMFIRPANPNSKYMMLDLVFDGMLITPPDEHISLFIPPLQQGVHYDSLPILNGFNNSEEGRISFGGIKHGETNFIFKGEELTISKPSLLQHTETIKGTNLIVNNKLSVGDKIIGGIYRATLNTVSNKRFGYITEVNRLYAFCNDAYKEHVGVLFAYYHIKRLGRAITEFNYEI